jgi:hypothetical protein
MKDKTYKFNELTKEVQQQVVYCYIYIRNLIPVELPEAFDELYRAYDWENPKETFGTYLCRGIEPAVWELYENSNKEFTKEGIDIETLSIERRKERYQK